MSPPLLLILMLPSEVVTIPVLAKFTFSAANIVMLPLSASTTSLMLMASSELRVIDPILSLSFTGPAMTSSETISVPSSPTNPSFPIADRSGLLFATIEIIPSAVNV